MGVLLLAVVRRWATFRGETRLNRMASPSPPFSRGEDLVVGNRCYRITRVLRIGGSPWSLEHTWEVWGLRQPGARRPQ